MYIVYTYSTTSSTRIISKSTVCISTNNINITTLKEAYDMTSSQYYGSVSDKTKHLQNDRFQNNMKLFANTASERTHSYEYHTESSTVAASLLTTFDSSGSYQYSTFVSIALTSRVFCVLKQHRAQSKQKLF